jgi:hypothetical protein
MKNLSFTLSLFLLVSSASAVPSFEPAADATATGGTAYNIGDPLTNQVNSTLFEAWYMRSGATAGTNYPKIVSGNLSHTNLPPSTGNSVAFVPGPNLTACANLGFGNVSHTNTCYYSFLVKITDLTGVSTASTINPFAMFIDDNSHINNSIQRRGTRLLTKQITSTTYVFGTSTTDSSTTVYEPDPAAHAIGETVFVVGSFMRTTTLTNTFLWINPPASSFGSNLPPAPTLIAPYGAPVNGGLNSSAAQAFALTCQFAGAPAGVVDEIRLSTNDWAYVTGGNPAVLQNPAGTNIVAGQSATLRVIARGTATLAYQWYKGATPVSNDSHISGSTTATLVISNATAGDNGAYSVFVTNGVGSVVQSTSASVSVTDPAISGQPQSRTNVYGTTATFTVVAAGMGPFSYQWHKDGFGDLSDGANVSGSHSSALSLSSVNYTNAASYSCTVTGGLGNVTSDSAVLTVRDPAVTVQPSSQTNLAGTTATFTVTAIGTPTLAYQWRKNGSDLADGGNVSGASTTALTLTGVSAADEAAYTVLVSSSGSGGSELSSSAQLTVWSSPAISIQPTPRSVTAGNRAVFSVGATGTAPLYYQWKRGGTNIPGATSFAYSIASAQAADAGSYSVLVSNFLNTAASSSATLTIVLSLTLAQSNLFVIRLGDGAQALSLNGNSMYLDQFGANGSYISTLCVPETTPSGIIAIGQPNVQGTSGNITGSGLSRSADGRLLVLAGYNTSIGYGSSLPGSDSVSVPRGIATVNSVGQYTLAVSSTNAVYTQSAFRTGVTDGTNNFWGCANKSGLYYFGFDDPEGSLVTPPTNIRNFGVFNGDLYYASAVSGNEGIWQVTGMPHGSSSSTLLFSGAGNFNADMDVSPDGTLIYVADDAPATSGGGILRFKFDGANWSQEYTLNSGLSTGARYVGADFSGPNPVLVAVTPEAENNRIVIIVDSGAGSPGTTIANAGVNQVFRGTRFGPIETVARPTLYETLEGNHVILSWTGAFVLQSATNADGPYADVASQTNPYTNSVNTAARKFFRLRN